MLVNLTRCMRYWDVARRMGHIEKGRLAEQSDLAFFFIYLFKVNIKVFTM